MNQQTVETSGKPVLKVLLVAYACSPYKGSEPSTGWGQVCGVGKTCEVWAIVKGGHQQLDIERYSRETGGLSNIHFSFLPKTRLERIVSRTPYCWYLAYNLWHRRAYKLAAKLHREIGFEVAHQGSIGSFREPGYIWRLGIPFVWGPTAGTENYPWPFLKEAGLFGAFSEVLRSACNSVQFRFSWRLRRALKRAGAVIVANSNIGRDFERIHGVRSTVVLDVGCHEVPVARSTGGMREGTLRLLWVGAFQHRKALHLLLKALEGVSSDCPYELRIIGDGALRDRWRGLAEQLGVSRFCRWYTKVPHHEMLAHYRWAELLVFTSLRDSCGSVVTEALSNGVPILCLDHNGVGDVIDGTCGIKIPPHSPAQVIGQLRQSILLLGRDRDKLSSLSLGALHRASQYTWDRHAERFTELYYRVLSEPSNEGQRAATRQTELGTI